MKSISSPIGCSRPRGRASPDGDVTHRTTAPSLGVGTGKHGRVSEPARWFGARLSGNLRPRPSGVPIRPAALKSHIVRLLRLLTRPRWGSVSPALGLALLLAACSASTTPYLPLVADRLVFLTPPSGVVAGQAFNPVVRVAVVDSAGNTATSVNNLDVTLYLDSTDPRDTLLGTVTIPTVGGVAVFSNLSLKRATAGFHLVAVSHLVTGATSSAFAVSVGPPAKLAFSVQPTSVIAGEKMIPPPQVVVQDAVGNPILNDSGLVVVTALTPNGAAPPRNNGVNETNGVAKFDSLRITTANPIWSLVANGPPSRGLQPATSNVFSVAPGAAFRLAWTQDAANNGKNLVFSPSLKVAVADSMGNIATQFTQNLTIDIDPPTNASGAILNGTTTVACVAGVATFPGISVDRATGSQIRLRAYHATLGDTARGAFFQVF